MAMQLLGEPITARYQIADSSAFFDERLKTPEAITSRLIGC